MVGIELILIMETSYHCIELNGEELDVVIEWEIEHCESSTDRGLLTWKEEHAKRATLEDAGDVYDFDTEAIEPWEKEVVSKVEGGDFYL